MALEFRPKGKGSFDLYDPAGMEGHYDETGYIGEIAWSLDRDEEDPEPDENHSDIPPAWYVYLWSNSGSGREWYADAAESLEEAKQWALEFYEELLADRREHGRRGTARVIPTPMGGQRRQPRR